MKLLYKHYKLFKFSIRRWKKITITVYRHHHCSYSILRHHNIMVYFLWYTTRPVFISKRSVAASNSISMIHNKLTTTTIKIIVQCSNVIYNIIIIYE